MSFSQLSSSKFVLRFALLACLANTAGLTACNAQNKVSTTQQKITALKGLRDSGILSQAEYDEKVAELKAPSSAPATSAHAGPAPRLGAPTVSHTLEDRGWGIPWGTVKLPAGWGFNGGVAHGDNCMVSGHSPMWTAESPDKTVGIAVLPILKAGWVSDQRTLAQMQQAGCPILQSTRAADFLTRIVLPHLHKDFKVVGTASEPMFEPMANQMRQMNAQAPTAQSQGFRTRNTVDTARVVITYQEAGALRVEIASAEYSCNETMMAGVGAMPNFQGLDCTSYQAVILHAPDDGTPITSFATMDLSKSTEKPFFVVTQNPAWQQRFSEVSQQQSQQIIAQGQANMKATQDNINRNQNTGGGAVGGHDPNESVADYSRRVHNKVFQDQQRANDQVTGAVTAHMGDYNVYTNNSTGQQYQMSNQFNNTYVNQQGTVGLQTNSANSPGVDWTQLTPKY